MTVCGERVSAAAVGTRGFYDEKLAQLKYHMSRPRAEAGKSEKTPTMADPDMSLECGRS
jgi:hypothetical protein